MTEWRESFPCHFAGKRKQGQNALCTDVLEGNGDGSYDTWGVRKHLLGKRIHQIIPQWKNQRAVSTQLGNDPLEWDDCVRQVLP